MHFFPPISPFRFILDLLERRLSGGYKREPHRGAENVQQN